MPHLTPFERWLARELDAYKTKEWISEAQDEALAGFSRHLADNIQTLDVEINEYAAMLDNIPGITKFYSEAASAILGDFQDWLKGGQDNDRVV